MTLPGIRQDAIARQSNPIFPKQMSFGHCKAPHCREDQRPSLTIIKL